MEILSFLRTKPAHEIEIILCCSHVHIEAKHIERIVFLLDQNIDWNILIQTAIKHDVVPLVYQNLKNVGSDSIPEEVLGCLHSISYMITLRNTSFLGELINILKLFEQNNIAAISFKGPVLALLAYGSLGLRSFCDLDIFVQKKDFLKACELLISEREYHPSYQWNFLDPNLEKSILESSHEYSLTDGKTSVDLHQVLTVEVFLSSSFTFDYLWHRLEPIQIAGQNVPSLGTEDLLMYLCIHGSKDCWRSLKWICDVSEFIHSHPEIHWGSLLKQAQTLGCERMLLLGLALAQEVLEVSLNEAVLQRIQDNSISRDLAKEFSHRLFSEQNNLGRDFTIEKFFLHWKMLERIKDKWYFFKDIGRHARHLFISYLAPHKEDELLLPLPRVLYFVYYFIRLTKLTKKWLFRIN